MLSTNSMVILYYTSKQRDGEKMYFHYLVKPQKEIFNARHIFMVASFPTSQVKLFSFEKKIISLNNVVLVKMRKLWKIFYVILKVLFDFRKNI